MPTYQIKSKDTTLEEEVTSARSNSGMSKQSQLEVFNERKGPNATAGVESQQLSLFGDAEGKALSTWLNTPGESQRSTTPIRDDIGSTYQSTRSSQPNPNIQNNFTYKSGTSASFDPTGAEGQLELNLNQSNLETGINRSATAGSKLKVEGNPLQTPRDLNFNGSVNLGGTQTHSRFNPDGSAVINQVGANLNGNANNQGIQSGTFSLNGNQSRSSTETGPNGVSTQNSNLNASGSVNASRGGIIPSVSAGYNKTDSNVIVWDIVSQLWCQWQRHPRQCESQSVSAAKYRHKAR